MYSGTGPTCHCSMISDVTAHVSLCTWLAKVSNPKGSIECSESEQKRMYGLRCFVLLAQDEMMKEREGQWKE